VKDALGRTGGEADAGPPTPGRLWIPRSPELNPPDRVGPACPLTLPRHLLTSGPFPTPTDILAVEKLELRALNPAWGSSGRKETDMLANDLRKGMTVHLRSGLRATVMDNKKGSARRVEIGEPSHEIGSVYIKDIAAVEREDGTWESVELSPRQEEEAMRQKLLGL
jgi:preprotein translocase subunit YajC